MKKIVIIVLTLVLIVTMAAVISHLRLYRTSYTNVWHNIYGTHATYLKEEVRLFGESQIIDRYEVSLGSGTWETSYRLVIR